MLLKLASSKRSLARWVHNTFLSSYSPDACAALAGLLDADDLGVDGGVLERGGGDVGGDRGSRRRRARGRRLIGQDGVVDVGSRVLRQ